VQATAAGIGVALGAVIRDGVALWDSHNAVTPYLTVYGLEMILLLGAVVIMFQLIRSPGAASRGQAAQAR
jgi:hypothetical protein